MARRGKIARLPKEVREELNSRLQSGARGDHLVVWLNGLEPVKAVLKEQFEGQPINETNLSAWKMGGYLEWEQAQAVSALAQQIQKNPGEWTTKFGEKRASECFATVLALKLAEVSQMLLDNKARPEQQWKRFCRVHEQLSRMRRDDYRSASEQWRQWD